VSAHPEIKMRDRTCFSKRRFSTQEAAEEEARKRHRERRCFVTLYVYECPFGETEKHFHLTKQERSGEREGVKVEV
jgi:hypothetical protein